MGCDMTKYTPEKYRERLQQSIREQQEKEKAARERRKIEREQKLEAQKLERKRKDQEKLEKLLSHKASFTKTAATIGAAAVVVDVISDSVRTARRRKRLELDLNSSDPKALVRVGMEVDQMKADRTGQRPEWEIIEEKLHGLEGEEYRKRLRELVPDKQKLREHYQRKIILKEDPKRFQHQTNSDSGTLFWPMVLLGVFLFLFLLCYAIG